MEIISSGQTFFVKRVLPAFWFGPMALITLITALAAGDAQEAALMLVPIGFGALGFLVMRKVWSFADEVRDGGKFLLVRRGGIEARVALADVAYVDSYLLRNPPHVTLHMRKPGRIGAEITFIPRQKTLSNPLSQDELVNELTARIADTNKTGVQT